ncbi:MAG: DMT family transporter, partial [Clostridia bacterium]|nr:DMT family transporter [Clostridia bacterium]
MEQSKNKFFKNPFIVAAFAIFCCALWGSATPFIKTGYELILPVKDTSSTILFAGIRFAIAGLLTVIIYSIARRRVLIPKRENLGRILTVSAFQTVLQYIFFYVGLANTTGVKGTVLSGSTAFFALLIAALIFRQEKLTVKKITACVLGFAGIIVVNLKGLDLNMNFFGDAFVLFSSIASAVSSILVKRFSKYEDPVVISGYQFIVGGLVMIGAGLSFGGRVQFTSLAALGVIIYLAMLSAVAYSLWGVLLKHNPVSKVSIYSFMTPVFGVILSEIMLAEEKTVSYLN